MILVGREKEKRQLLEIQASDKSAFVALYGRRRVGKTYLVREVFPEQISFYSTGLANAGTASQLTVFHAALQKYEPERQNEVPKDWFGAFQQLMLLLERKPAGRKIIFLDELPWMDTATSGFIPALEHFWNAWASARKDIALIVCGSAAGWMISNLINNTGGLHNRVTHRIRLSPFNLSECEQFLREKGSVWDRYQLIQLYMAMGGIPFYLDLVDSKQSAAQNINRLCFEKDGQLREEFNNLYRSLFNKSEKHIAVVEILSQRTKGLTRKEIIEKTQLSEGGSSTRILNELIESDFIRKYPSYGKSKNDSLYQLIDCYSLFYLKWIKNSSSLDEGYWISQIDSPAQRAWSGYAFEQICLYHLREIKIALGISGVQTESSSWIGRSERKGAQIDLVIDRRDRVINICEMKFSIDTYTIDKKYADELRNKLNVFRAETETKKALFLTLITTFGITQNKYSALIQNEVKMDALFSAKP